MNSKLREQEVRKVARGVLRELDLERLPVNPREIASRRDIEVRPWVSAKKGVSGFLMHSEGEFGIGFSTAMNNEGFENFTIGHELGHYFLDGHPEALLGSGVHYSRSGFLSGDRYEREADVFAAELLMPGDLVERELHRSDLGLAAAEAIAELCNTSLTAAAIRYAEKSPDPVVVVMSEGESVVWAIPSQAIRDYRSISWIRKGAPLPQSSATYAFNGYPENVELARRNERGCKLSDWLDGAPAVDSVEEVVGLGHYGRTLTIVSTEVLEESGARWGGDDEEEFGEEGDYIQRMRDGRFRRR